MERPNKNDKKNIEYIHLKYGKTLIKIIKTSRGLSPKRWNDLKTT